MKVLMITHTFPPLVGIASERHEYFYKWLSKKSDVTVITKKQFRKMRNEIAHPNIHKKLGIPDRFLPFLPPGYGHVFQMVSSGLRKDFDIIYASSPPIGSIIAGYTLKEKTGKPLIAEVRDLWPWDKKSKSYRSDKEFAKLFYENSDRIVVTNPGLKDELIKEYKLDANKIHVVYNGVDLSKIKFNSKKKFDKFTIVCFQTLYLMRGLDKLIEGAKESNLNVKLVFLGYGGDKEKLEELARKLNVDAEFPGVRIGKELYEIINGADVCFVGLDDNPYLTYRISGTLYASMALGKPVIATGLAKGDTHKIVKQFNCGIFVYPNAKEIAKAIRKLYSNQRLRKALGNNGRIAARKNFTFEKSASELYKVMRDVYGK